MKVAFKCHCGYERLVVDGTSTVMINLVYLRELSYERCKNCCRYNESHIELISEETLKLERERNEKGAREMNKENKSIIKLHSIERIQEMLLGCMEFIDGVIVDEPFYKDRECYENEYVDRLDDIKCEISKVIIHVERLIKYWIKDDKNVFKSPSALEK